MLIRRSRRARNTTAPAAAAAAGQYDDIAVAGVATDSAARPSLNEPRYAARVHVHPLSRPCFAW